MLGLSGHPNLNPQDPSREAESSGSGLSPCCTNTDEVVGHLGSSHKAFILQKLISGECDSFFIQIGVLPEPCVAAMNPGLTDLFSQARLFCFDPAPLCTPLCKDQTLLWEDQPGSRHTWHSVTMQTCTTSVSKTKTAEVQGENILLQHFQLLSQIQMTQI